MFDLWGFLLQTLTVSGVAVLLLVIKALFKDKLPPKWHFAVWGVLGIMILIPAGFNGRYTLFHWQFVIEVLKSFFKDYSFTQVLFPVPVLTAVPKTVTQWIFAVYFFGVAAHIIKYPVSYIRLRLVLRKGITPNDELLARIREIADAHKVQVKCVIAVYGLPSAFVCGIVRPILVIPADKDIDCKVILHELLHIKYRDTLLSAVICFLRCLHWCNPLIVYCANQAINDMEARCDQHVLEQLRGEERRDYGQILLSMANERFAKTPGSTRINNGGKNIRKRIEAIARFKKYPVGMNLASICVIILLSVSLVTGAQASTVYESNGNSLRLSLASARSIPCTTPAGAFDAYAKAVLNQNGLYRIMCASQDMQQELLNEISKKEKCGIFPTWDSGLNEYPDEQSGYYIYNLKKSGKNAYEGLLTLKLIYPPNGQEKEGGIMYLAVQRLRVQKENGRWVATALEDFRNIKTAEQRLEWGCDGLSGIIYSGTASNFRVDVKMQTVYTVKNTVQQNSSFPLLENSSSRFYKAPNPNAEFTEAIMTQSKSLTHLGTAEDRDTIERLGLSVAAVYRGKKRPGNLTPAIGYSSAGSNSSGESWGSQKTESGWGPTFMLNSGGGGSIDSAKDPILPEYYAADLYINDELAAQFDLHLQKEAE